MANGFTIIADIEAKATLAAITDHDTTKVIVNGLGGDIMSLLLSIINGVSEMYTDVEETDSDAEKIQKAATFMSDLIAEYGEFVTKKYSCEEDEE